MLAEDDPVKMRMDIIDEQLDTVGQAFMGLTLGCARCHDHRFDPITAQDYYGLAGFFYSTETSDLKIPALRPAPELQAKASYTLTILNDAPNQAGAARFVDFLLSASGRALLKQHGVDIVKPVVTGNAQVVPSSVQAVLDAAQ